MLPNVVAQNGVDLFDFDQATDFPLRLANTMTAGVCSGLSLLWIKKNKLGQGGTFVNTISAPSSIRDVENVQSTSLGSTATARILRETDLRQGVGKDITTNVTAARVAAALGLTIGFEWLSFLNRGGQHTVALARTATSVDFFDPNYGAARFFARDRFKTWFQNDYWAVNGGPGNPGPCTRFIVQSFY